MRQPFTYRRRGEIDSAWDGRMCLHTERGLSYGLNLWSMHLGPKRVRWRVGGLTAWGGPDRPSELDVTPGAAT